MENNAKPKVLDKFSPKLVHRMFAEQSKRDFGDVIIEEASQEQLEGGTGGWRALNQPDLVTSASLPDMRQRVAASQFIP
jgi:hypothetical protein